MMRRDGCDTADLLDALEHVQARWDYGERPVNGVLRMRFSVPIGDGFAKGSKTLISTSHAMAIIRNRRVITAFPVIAPVLSVAWAIQTRSFQPCCEIPMTLTEARKQFLKHCGSAISLSPHTMRAYCSDLHDTQKYFGFRKQLKSVEKDHLRQYIRDLRENRGFKETTIKRRLASLKLMFKWAIQEEIVRINPFESLNERIRLPKRLPRALDRTDYAALRRAVQLAPRTDDFNNTRNKTAIHLLLDTGIRVGELVAINLDDLSLPDGCLLIHGKGNRQRFVYLLERPLCRKMQQYLTWRSSVPNCTGKLFVSSDGQSISTSMVRAALAEIARSGGIAKHITPHMLRHTCATQWLESGLDIRYVQKLLGHQSISTTEIYTHVSDQGLREALSRAGGARKR